MGLKQSTEEKFKDIRGTFLSWLLPFILLILIYELYLVYLYPKGNNEKGLFYILLSFFLILSIVAFYFTLKGKNGISSYLTIIIATAGTWGSVLVEYFSGKLEFFPLIFISINVVLSSLLVATVFTTILSVLQIIGLYVVFDATTPIVRAEWGNFMAYILIISILSIGTSYIIGTHIRQLKDRAIKDYLTGLFSRRYFDETLNTMIQRSSSDETNFGVILIDVDNFKRYNDAYGHYVGDKILQTVSQFLSDEVEDKDLVFRHGGDEFSIIIKDTTHENLYTKAQAMIDTIDHLDFSDFGFDFNHLTLSMGIALFPTNGTTEIDLMQHADRRLFASKAMGKNQVSF